MSPNGKRALPEVTVLISTYHRADFLGEAIDSVLQQSFTDFELLIIDDGSSDGTSTILNYAMCKSHVGCLAAVRS